jgi:ABC-type cobalamin/Fe3+-siderophores transport system ATPase subunit
MKHCYHLGADEVKITFCNRRTTIVGPCGGGKSTILRGMFDVFRLFSGGVDPGAALIERMFEFHEKDGAFALLELRKVGVVGFFDRARTAQGALKIVASKEIPETHAKAECDENIKLLAQKFFSEHPFAYCPQDHGLRFPARISAPSIEMNLGAVAFPLPSVSSPAGLKTGVQNSQLEAAFEKITGLRMFSQDWTFQFNDQPKFGLEGLSGGQIDALLSLDAALNATASVVLLDEPGQNLGAFERSLLRQVLCSMPTQVIIVTHHIEMVPNPSSEMIVRFTLPASSAYRSKPTTKIQMCSFLDAYKEHVKSFDDDGSFFRWLTLPQNRCFWFARGVLLVEGESEPTCIDALLQAYGKNGNCYQILECDGRGDVLKKWELLSRFCIGMDIPVLALVDYDVLSESHGGHSAFCERTKLSFSSLFQLCAMPVLSNVLLSQLKVGLQELAKELKSPLQRTSFMGLSKAKDHDEWKGNLGVENLKARYESANIAGQFVDCVKAFMVAVKELDKINNAEYTLDQKRILELARSFQSKPLDGRFVQYDLDKLTFKLCDEPTAGTDPILDARKEATKKVEGLALRVMEIFLLLLVRHGSGFHWSVLGYAISCSLWKSDEKKEVLVDLGSNDKCHVLKEARSAEFCELLSEQLNRLLRTRSTHGGYVWPRSVADIEGCFFLKAPIAEIEKDEDEKLLMEESLKFLDATLELDAKNKTIKTCFMHARGLCEKWKNALKSERKSDFVMVVKRATRLRNDSKIRGHVEDFLKKISSFDDLPDDPKE